MSYMVKEDGKVEFSCHGCSKTKTTNSLASLPKNWCITGILVSQHHEEFRDEGDTVPTEQKLRECNEQLAAHFCSKKCAKKKLLAPQVREYVERMGITLVLYSGCDTIVDGTTAKEQALVEKKKKWVHPENRPESDAGDAPGVGDPKATPPDKDSGGPGRSPI
jgi:hypothetical protein